MHGGPHLLQLGPVRVRAAAERGAGPGPFRLHEEVAGPRAGREHLRPAHQRLRQVQVGQQGGRALPGAPGQQAGPEPLRLQRHDRGLRQREAHRHGARHVQDDEGGGRRARRDHFQLPDQRVREAHVARARDGASQGDGGVGACARRQGLHRADELLGQEQGAGEGSRRVPGDDRQGHRGQRHHVQHLGVGLREERANVPGEGVQPEGGREPAQLQRQGDPHHPPAQPQETLPRQVRVTRVSSP
mmetsp:Transcript_19491/g.52359  ORF Transcript_19491/g.52359 Transcript_19491/m.52359 type:complete len:244 (-) Transcript_19491:145-876(-)